MGPLCFVAGMVNYNSIASRSKQRPRENKGYWAFQVAHDYKLLPGLRTHSALSSFSRIPFQISSTLPAIPTAHRLHPRIITTILFSFFKKDTEENVREEKLANTRYFFKKAVHAANISYRECAIPWTKFQVNFECNRRKHWLCRCIF